MSEREGRQGADSFHTAISQTVKRLRQEHGISQLEMALELGQSSSAFYANAENRKQGKHFNLEHLYRMAPLFHMSAWELIRMAEEYAAMP